MGTVDRILRNLRFDLSQRKVLLVFDEAHHLSIECLETIRELLDQPPHCGLLFAGTHELEQIFTRQASELEQWRSRFHAGQALPGISEEAAAIVHSELGLGLSQHITIDCDWLHIPASSLERIMGSRVVSPMLRVPASEHAHGATADSAEAVLHSNANVPLQASRERRLLVSFAWASILLISDLPDIIWHSIFRQTPEKLFWMKVGVLGLLLVACSVWKRIRPLWQFAGVMLVFYLAFAASTWTGNTSWWRSRFSGPQVSFTIGYCGAYLRDLGVAFAVIAALWLIKHHRSEFFLVKGQLNAPIEPVRWLGIRRGESWRTFGWIFAIVAGLGVLIPTALGLRLTSDALLRAAPLLPAGLLFAAVNAFNEEIYFRASLLSTLPAVIGRTHALLINVVFFGLAHYLHGSPPGVVGFLMTGFLAWLLGKSMLETRGLAWAWFMHFVPDVIIFASYAILWRT